MTLLDMNSYSVICHCYIKLLTMLPSMLFVELAKYEFLFWNMTLLSHPLNFNGTLWRLLIFSQCFLFH